jgi:hypothetical protein
MKFKKIVRIEMPGTDACMLASQYALQWRTEGGGQGAMPPPLADGKLFFEGLKKTRKQVDGQMPPPFETRMEVGLGSVSKKKRSSTCRSLKKGRQMLASQKRSYATDALSMPSVN